MKEIDTCSFVMSFLFTIIFVPTYISNDDFHYSILNYLLNLYHLFNHSIILYFFINFNNYDKKRGFLFFSDPGLLIIVFPNSFRFFS